MHLSVDRLNKTLIIVPTVLMAWNKERVIIEIGWLLWVFQIRIEKG